MGCLKIKSNGKGHSLYFKSRMATPHWVNNAYKRTGQWSDEELQNFSTIHTWKQILFSNNTLPILHNEVNKGNHGKRILNSVITYQAQHRVTLEKIILKKYNSNRETLKAGVSKRSNLLRVVKIMTKTRIYFIFRFFFFICSPCPPWYTVPTSKWTGRLIMSFFFMWQLDTFGIHVFLP